MTRVQSMFVLFVVAVGFGCSDVSNAPMTGTNLQPSASGYGSQSDYSRVAPVGLYPNVSAELSGCGLAQEVAARFSGPGFIHGTRVGFFVSFFGMPEGEKKLRIFWDMDNRPGEFQTVSMPDEDPIEDVIEHEYLNARIGDERKVRVELLIAGQSAECARNRHITLRDPLPEGGGASVTGNTTLCDLGWTTTANGGICGIPSDPSTSYFFDFDAVSKVPAGAPSADLSKGHVDCCNWNSQNGATQVDTGIPAAQFPSVVCGPSDGRVYAATAINYFQPNATVICLRTASGRYVKYTGRTSCCGDITIDFTAF